MTFVMLLPAILSLVVLGAHFLRAGNQALVVVVLGLLAILMVRRPWASRAVQAALAVGALEWVRTLFALATERMRSGEPVMRLVLILGSVAVVTCAAALMLSSARLRRLYGCEGVRPDGNQPD